MKFSISILTYTAGTLAKRCIASVLANSPAGDFELLLTDNGADAATKDHFDLIERQNPNVTVFHNAKNEGFIEPNRRAFKMARGRYFILLNDDTVVPEGWLEKLHAAFLIDPNCALSGVAGACCQLRPDFHGEVGPRFEYLEGSCLMMDVEKVRALEPNLFPPELVGAYGEDSYLSLRVRSAGYTLARVPLLLQHVRCATSALVPQCRDWQANNHAFLHKRFKGYMKSRRFDTPVILRRAAAWGDCLLMTPIIRALKAKNPLWRIQVETICPDVFNGNPDVTYVARQINVSSADTEDHNLNGVFEMQPGRHIVDVFAETVGLKPGEYDKVTKLYPPQGDVEWAKRTVEGGEWVAVHPGPTTWRCKNWLPDRWQAVIDFIRSKGRKVVLIGNDTMMPLTGDLDLRKKTNVGQLAALLGECKLFVGVDSFPIHAAQAVGCPVVGVFGITRPDLLLTEGSPWYAATSPAEHPGTGLRHKTAGKTSVDCPQNPMDDISIENVTGILEKLLCKIPV